MPIVQISQAESRETYGAVSNRLGLASNHPAGLILHSASETASGEVQIIDVWETAQHAGAFERERLFPAFEAAGVTDQIASRARPVAYEPFEYAVRK
jgi:hypothetical protein